MVLDSARLQLVQRAVFGKDMKLVGHLLFNKAAEELRVAGMPALPEIEHVLIHEVQPLCTESGDVIPAPALGASDVLVAYFELSKTRDIEETVRFFLSLRWALRVEAMRAINTVWFYQQSPNGPVPPSLTEAVKLVASTGAELERRTANWLLQKQQEKLGPGTYDFRDELFKHIRNSRKGSSEP